MNRTIAKAVPLRLQQRVHRALPAPAWRLLRDVGTGSTPVQRRATQLRLERLRRSAQDEVQGPLAAVRYRGERFLACPVERFTALEAIAANAALVADALERVGIDYLVVDAPVSRPRVIAVTAPAREAAVDALVAAGQGLPVYIREVHPRNDRRSVRLNRFAGCASRADAWSVFQVFAADGADEALCGPELGCVLEFWRELAVDVPDDHATGEPLVAGSWVAPRRNRWLDAVPGDIGEPARWNVDGTDRPAIPALNQQHAFDVTFPIDVVYTWVDGSDPAWQQRKAVAHEAVGLGELNEYASNESRYLSRDELRFSLRSLDMYASWVRHVYLVTDDQVPSWLDTSNPRITVVSHCEVFGDRGKLPTFNSHAIESQLHHIDGLSDHFLYLNDDFFFGRPVQPRTFFDGNGIGRFFTSTAKLGLGATGAFDRPVMSGGKNNRELLFKAFDRTVTNKFKHVPQSLHRDLLFEMEERFADKFEATASHQFRNPADLSVLSSFHHHYAYLRGRSVEGRMRYFYADIAAPETARRLERMLRERNYDTFCLNDHDTSGVDPLVQQRMLRSFLFRYFPLRSSFEK